METNFFPPTGLDLAASFSQSAAPASSDVTRCWGRRLGVGWSQAASQEISGSCSAASWSSLFLKGRSSVRRWVSGPDSPFRVRWDLSEMHGGPWSRVNTFRFYCCLRSTYLAGACLIFHRSQNCFSFPCWGFRTGSVHQVVATLLNYFQWRGWVFLEEGFKLSHLLLTVCCVQGRGDSLGKAGTFSQNSNWCESPRITNWRPPEILIMKAVILLPQIQKLYVNNLWHHHLYAFWVQWKGGN